MFSADGKILHGVAPRRIFCWETATGKLISTSEMAGPEALVSASCAPDGRWMATAGTDNQLDVWDVASGAKLQSFRQPFGIAYQLAFSPDGRHLLSVAQGGSFLWDIATGVQLAELVSFEQGKDWLVVTPEGLCDGSPGTPKRLTLRGHGERDNRSSLDVESNRFPELLSALLKGNRPLPEMTPTSDDKTRSSGR